MSKGYLNDGTNAGQIDFTAQHRTLPSNGSIIEYKDKIGYIVSSSGDIDNLDGSSLPTVDEALPKIKLSNKAKDKKIYGVISGIEEVDSSKTRTIQLGIFATNIERSSEDDYRVIVNSGGEGGVWVSNFNGKLENGDFVTTSPINGVGMKQDDDLLHNYTVAKIVMDCNFKDSEKYEIKEINYKGKKYKMAFVACIYLMN